MLHLTKVLCLILAATATGAPAGRSVTSSKEWFDKALDSSRARIYSHYDRAKPYLKNAWSEAIRTMERRLAQDYSRDNGALEWYVNCEKAYVDSELRLVTAHIATIKRYEASEIEVQNCLSSTVNDGSDDKEVIECIRKVRLGLPNIVEEALSTIEEVKDEMDKKITECHQLLPSSGSKRKPWSP